MDAYTQTKNALEDLEVKYAHLKNLITKEILVALDEYNDACENVRKSGVGLPIGSTITTDNFGVRNQKKASRGQVDYPSVELYQRALLVGGINAVKGLNKEFLATQCGVEGQVIVGELLELTKAHVGNTSDNGTTEKTVVLTDKTTLKTQLKIALEWKATMERCVEAYKASQTFSVSIEPREEGAAAPLPAQSAHTEGATQ